MTPDHAFAIRRQARALRQYLNARHQFTHPEPGKFDEAHKAYSAAEVELMAAAQETVLTAHLDEGSETSPLMGGIDADR